MEEAFSDNQKPEENWDFHYYTVSDETGRVVLATFFTVCLLKDDFLSPASVSLQIEARRKQDHYFLSSRTVTMGSMISEGDHLWIDRRHDRWREALRTLLDEATRLQEETRAARIVLRDFDADDEALRDFLLNEGFFKVDMPNSNVIEDLRWTNVDDFLSSLSQSGRRNVRADALRYQHLYDVEVKDQITPEEAAEFYRLHLNVKERNYGVNYYDYPQKLIPMMSKHRNWEFIILRLRPTEVGGALSAPVAVSLSYKTATHYNPLLVGMNYDYLISHKVYKQTLYQMVKRAGELGLNRIFFGLTADLEKRKLGARQVAKVAFIQTKDTFSMELLESMAVAPELERRPVVARPAR